MNGLFRVFAGAAVTLLAVAAAAQTYPSRPVRVILGVPAGGTPDVLARTVIPGMSDLLGQPLVIDNRGGAGGRIGIELASRATPDGYTLLFTAPGLTILPHVQRDVPFDPVRDFAPIGLIATSPFLLLVHPSVPAKSVKELIALARAEPGILTYASAGNGATNHLTMELFKSMAGVNITHVPYKGAPQAVTDLIGGRVKVMFNSIAPIMGHLKAGRVVALGTSGLQRAPQLPDIPTISEAGVPGYEMVNWFGMLAPAKTPQPIVTRVAQVLVEALRMPETRAQFEALGTSPVGDGPQEYAAFIRRETEKYAKVVKFAGMKVD
jgi:tripartite-type tricarboxylate transporter receptor subunit TctC